jgi:hypothetical protein
MPRGEKAGNTGVKPHRARKIAQSMRRQGATRAAANQIATTAMDREYAPKKSGNPRKAKKAFDEEAHDSRSGQRKTNLTTKKGAAVSGASKPSRARKAPTTKGGVRQTGRSGKSAPARRPRAAKKPATRASARQSAVGTRPPQPRKAGEVSRSR